MGAFSKYSFLYPPRPTSAVPISMLKFYESKGWIAQHKKNGTCTVLYVSPEKEVLVRTRHDTPHKAWKPTEKSTGIFKTLPGDKWYALVVEVLHSKTSKVKDTVYIFDILVENGESLVGKTLIERQKILNKLFPTNVESVDQSHYVINENVWLVKNLTKGFYETMTRLQEAAEKIEGNSENEGLVLKNPNAKLLSLGRKDGNSSWQVKCRVETKNYSF